MALSPSIPLLEAAAKTGRAIGAFNVGNMEMLIGLVRAAEDMNTPVILQVAEKRLSHTPLHLVAPMMVEAARQSRVDIAVQLDHGFDMGIIRSVISYGFTAVMFDGSGLPLPENIARTKDVVALAAKAGVVVEAEIGMIGGSEGGAEHQIRHTCPSEAKALADGSGCASLAVAIGNAHGHYQGKPELNFAVLEEIAQLVPVPLVLHGGSGISAEYFRHAINLGIRKINIATASFDALADGAGACSVRNDCNYFKLSESMVEAVYESAVKHIKIFNNRP